MAKRRRRAEPHPAWLRGFSQLDDIKLTMKLTGGKITRQQRIDGLRRIPKSISLHPTLMVEWLTAAAAMGESPARWLARKLAEDWGYDSKDI